MKKPSWKEVYFQSKMSMLDIIIFMFSLIIATIIVSAVTGGILSYVLTNL